ncbi:LOW QUALITY PROTEIN: large ribosomal subunit protein mL49-like [Ylistrum balloti]|uniref:LOW QUALITY PROTEIN: large ribosomal subunit protein mL49-like n=1 Tax=Ylistrum balloti TaxID=509963 RepID=UPI0029059DD2|nr:LOW QUALITY PROTEIN: large ribosomal subunit protein mL49-like [Ylistrum balloti]
MRYLLNHVSTRGKKSKMSAPVKVLWSFSKRLVLGKCHFSTRFVSTSSVNCRSSRYLPEYTDYEVSKEDFKYVKKLLPSDTVPEPPEVSGPTASGWVPQKEIDNNAYWIRRTKNHMLPVYLQEKNGGLDRVTKIGKIEGDIWAFDKDLRNAVGKKVNKRILTQINEVSRSIKLRGNYVKEVGEFLVSQGL